MLEKTKINKQMCGLNQTAKHDRQMWINAILRNAMLRAIHDKA
jgi:hypothetical protein